MEGGFAVAWSTVFRAEHVNSGHKTPLGPFVA